MTVDSSSLEEGMRTSNADFFMSPYFTLRCTATIWPGLMRSIMILTI